MIEGLIKIYLSHKEPIVKESTLWLRPFLHKEGYELLYFGANGWTPLINCKCSNNDNSVGNSVEQEPPCGCPDK